MTGFTVRAAGNSTSLNSAWASMTVLTGFAVRAAGNRDLYDAARAPCLQPSKAKWYAGCRTRRRQMGRGRSSTLASLRMPQAVAALAAPYTTMGRVLACHAHSSPLPCPCGPRQAQSTTRPGDQNAHLARQWAHKVYSEALFRVKPMPTTAHTATEGFLYLRPGPAIRRAFCAPRIPNRTAAQGVAGEEARR